MNSAPNPSPTIATLVFLLMDTNRINVPRPQQDTCALVTKGHGNSDARDDTIQQSTCQRQSSALSALEHSDCSFRCRRLMVPPPPSPRASAAPKRLRPR